MANIKIFLKKYLSDITYGATDGIITTFVIVAGASGAKLPKLAIIIGLSSLLADSVSMGASRYLSLRSELEIKDPSSDFVKPFIHALITAASFIISGSVPLLSFLLPFFYFNNFMISSIFSGFVLFLIGLLRGYITNKNLYLAGAETLLIGLMAGLIGFFIGERLNQI
ncbi:MAG: protein of unknown function transrane [Francisellaceae bacterium]|nr:protein of unknown function transrane [Francisellaceae bacterium]